MATVSVIIPTYNCSRFLVESLESVFAQTSPPTEVIVVDDGSTDDTPDLLARYADRLTVVRGEHAGYAAARNIGLAHARGDWIASQDADDVALPDRLAFQLDFLRRHPGLDAIFCNGERMDATSETDAHLVPRDLARRCSGRLLTPADLFDGYPAYFQGALVARHAVDATGRFDVRLTVHPDLDYAYRLFARSRVTFIDRTVFRYRWHATNVSRDRLVGREDLALILERLDNEQSNTLRSIGRRRLRWRLARHYYRIARRYLALGNTAKADAAAARAVDLRPLNLRYQFLRLWHLQRGRAAARGGTGKSP